jgi:hypothetical protein
VQATDLEEIKAVLWEQASHPCTRVSWGTAQVMAARKNRGQLRVMLRGRGRWYPVPPVTISRPLVCPIGAYDLEEGLCCASMERILLCISEKSKIREVFSDQ